MALDVATGMALTFQSGLVAAPTSIRHTGYSRGVVDITSMATTTARAKMPTDLYDPGRLEIDFLLDPDDDYETAIAAASETVTVTYPLQSGQITATTRAASGFATNIEFEYENEEVMSGSCTIELTGAVTLTAST